MEIRKTKRDAQCKSCHNTIVRNTDDVVYFYSHLNRGTHVHICMDCVDKMFKMLQEKGHK